MSLCNSTTVILLVMAGLASWNYPWGVVLDGAIVVVWVLAKRKRNPTAQAAARATQGQASSGDDAIKLLAMSMLSDRVNASGNAAATSLGLPPAPVKKASRARSGGLSPDDYAARQRLLD